MFSRTRLVLLAAMLIAVMLATGCSSLPWSKKTPLTVADPTGLFHVKAPADWRARVEPGLIALYGSKELPKADSFDALSVLVFTGQTAPKAQPMETALPEMVKKRGEQKKWQGAKYGKPTKTKLGTREAYVLEVEAKDSKGRPFTGLYYLARTNDTEVFVVAVSPSKTWGEDEKKVEALTKAWYWHKPEVKSADGTATAKPAATKPATTK